MCVCAPLITILLFLRRSQAARGKDGLKDGVSEMGTRLDPVPGLPGGQSSSCSVKTCGWTSMITFFVFPYCALALPPPPALDEEVSANYFNLDPSSSPAVMNISLPPPPGINPPPPGETSFFSSSLTLFSPHMYRSGVADSVSGCSHYARLLIFNLLLWML